MCTMRVITWVLVAYMWRHMCAMRTDILELLRQISSQFCSLMKVWSHDFSLQLFRVQFNLTAATNCQIEIPSERSVDPLVKLNEERNFVNHSKSIDPAKRGRYSRLTRSLIYVCSLDHSWFSIMDDGVFLNKLSPACTYVRIIRGAAVRVR